MNKSETDTSLVEVRLFCSNPEDPTILAAVNDSYYGDKFGGHAWIETIENTLNFAAFDGGVVRGLAIVALAGRASKTQEVEHKLMLKCSEGLTGTLEGDEIQQGLFDVVERVASERGITNLQIKVGVDCAKFFLKNGFEQVELDSFFGEYYFILTKKLDTPYVSEYTTWTTQGKA